MKNQIKCFIIFILAAVSINCLNGQETNFASNVKRSLSVDGKGLTIEYDIAFRDTTQLFDIILNLVHNGNIIQPRENNLHGAWGNGVKPGIEKVILWDFTNEFKDDINKVTVDIVAIKTREPSADFDFKILSSKPPFGVKFVNKSKNADTYSWKFGDLKSGKDNLSTLPSPDHKFKSSGNYNVELIAGNKISNTIDSIMKVVALGKGNEQEVQKHKKMKTIFLGSAVVSAGIGGYCIVKSVGLYNDSKTTTTEDPEELRKESKTYGVIGAVALVVSGVCITEVIIQSGKIKAAEQTLSMHFIPLDKGGALGLALRF